MTSAARELITVFVTTPDGGRPRKRFGRAFKLTLSTALLLLLVAGAVSLVLYLRYRSRPVPTVARAGKSFVKTVRYPAFMPAKLRTSVM